jgi:ABC-2 type transport system ATP-binding protein
VGLITLENVTKSFGPTVAVDHVSFSVDRGEVVGFLGPNGAGKSTTMRLITNYLEPETGAVRIDGQDTRLDPVAARRRIGYLPENNPLYTEMLVDEYLRFVGDLRGRRASPRSTTGRSASCRRATGSGSGWRRRSCTGRTT